MKSHVRRINGHRLGKLKPYLKQQVTVHVWQVETNLCACCYHMVYHQKQHQQFSGRFCPYVSYQRLHGTPRSTGRQFNLLWHSLAELLFQYKFRSIRHLFVRSISVRLLFSREYAIHQREAQAYYSAHDRHATLYHITSSLAFLHVTGCSYQMPVAIENLV